LGKIFSRLCIEDQAAIVIPAGRGEARTTGSGDGGLLDREMRKLESREGAELDPCRKRALHRIIRNPVTEGIDEG
jgi:hypothetical protein